MISWIKKLLFRFKFWRATVHIAIDPAVKGEDFETTVHYKIVDGQVYVLSIEQEQSNDR